jgi:hypothetical protein
MRWIRFYRFNPSTQPPIEIKRIYPWFKEEIKTASIEPLDTFVMTEQWPTGGKLENLAQAKNIFSILKRIKKAYTYLKQNL